jgi:hypothetical protein
MKTPSPSLHPGFIDKLISRDSHGDPVPDEALQHARAAMAAAGKSAAKWFAIAVAISNDPSVPAPVRALKARDAIGPLAIAAAKALDQQRAVVAAELQSLRQATSAPPPPTDATAVLLQQEIRARLSTMDNPRRGELLHRAVIDGDDQIIGALLHAPGWLSNVTDAEREMRRAGWRAKKFPDAVEREKRIEQALQVVDRSGKILIEYAQSLIDGEQAEKVLAAQAATARAMAS